MVPNIFCGLDSFPRKPPVSIKGRGSMLKTLSSFVAMQPLPPTVACLRKERRRAEADRARALNEKARLEEAEEECRKQMARLENWNTRLAKWERRIKVKIDLADAALKVLFEKEAEYFVLDEPYLFF